MIHSELNPDLTRFTEDALRLLAEANIEAERRRHEYVGTEHLILALSMRSKGIAAQILQQRGVDRFKLHEALSATVASGRVDLPAGSQRVYTSRTKQAFAFAAKDADVLGHAHIGVEHVLLGVLRERKNIGAQMLHDHGLTWETAAEEVRRLAAEGLEQ